MTVEQSRVVIVIMDGVAINSDQRACERPGWDRGVVKGSIRGSVLILLSLRYT